MTKHAAIIHLVDALKTLDAKHPAVEHVANALVNLTGGEGIVEVKAARPGANGKPKASAKPKAKPAKPAKRAKRKAKRAKPAKPAAEVIDLDAERRERPTKWVKGKWEFHSFGAVMFLDTWKDCLTAAAHLPVDALVSTKRPDGTWRFRNAAAGEVVKLGGGLGASLREKAQKRRTA